MDENKNMVLYNRGAVVPEEAIKPITAGRLKGFSDINPMWRIKRLTEMFGPCGIGWWYEITDKHMERGRDNEIRAFVDINLFYEYEGKVSRAIPGTGGSSFVTNEKSGVYVSDECYKMALTDAISVAAKALGIGASVFYAKDRDKYTRPEEPPKPQQRPTQNQPQQKPPQEAPQEQTRQKSPVEAPDGYLYCSKCHNIINGVPGRNGAFLYPRDVAEISISRYGEQLCANCAKERENFGGPVE